MRRDRADGTYFGTDPDPKESRESLIGSAHTNISKIETDSGDIEDLGDIEDE